MYLDQSLAAYMQAWLTVIDADWPWVTAIDHDWLWLTVIDFDWPWLTLIDCDWPWLTLIDRIWAGMTASSIPALIVNDRPGTPHLNKRNSMNMVKWRHESTRPLFNSSRSVWKLVATSAMWSGGCDIPLPSNELSKTNDENENIKSENVKIRRQKCHVLFLWIFVGPIDFRIEFLAKNPS